MEMLPSRRLKALKAAYSCNQENRKTRYKFGKRNASFHAREAAHWILKTGAEIFLTAWIHAVIFSISMYVVQHLQ